MADFQMDTIDKSFQNLIPEWISNQESYYYIDEECLECFNRPKKKLFYNVSPTEDGLQSMRKVLKYYSKNKETCNACYVSGTALFGQLKEMIELNKMNEDPSQRSIEKQQKQPVEFSVVKFSRNVFNGESSSSSDGNSTTINVPEI
jgi:hypothetical protein